MDMLTDFGKRIDRLKSKGVNIVEFYVHPLSIEGLVAAMKNSGMDPFPKSHWNWRHPFRNLDQRLYLFGYPVSLSSDCPIGVVGLTSTTPLPKDDEDITPVGMDRSTPLKDLANASTGSPTDVIVMAMEGIENYKHVVVLRWTASGNMDAFSTFNQIELPTMIQRAYMVMLQNGGQ